MQIEQLVKMVQKIDGFFRSEPDNEEAIKNIADHLNRFWDPRMRIKIVAYVKEGGAGLSDRSLAAIARLNPTSARFRMNLETKEEAKQNTHNKKPQPESAEAQTEAILAALAGR